MVKGVRTGVLTVHTGILWFVVSVELSIQAKQGVWWYNNGM